MGPPTHGPARDGARCTEDDERHRDLDPAERDAGGQERRPEDTERGDAEQITEPCEPQHDAPGAEAAEAPEDGEPDEGVREVQRREPGERAHASRRTSQDREPSSASSQTGAAPGYALRSHAKQRIHGASGLVRRGRRKYRM